MWLGEARGNAVDWATQRWVQLTGRRAALSEHPWLDAPAGKTSGIGNDFFNSYARERNLTARAEATSGLLPSLELLRSPEFDPARVAPGVADFYTRTAAYDMDAWAQWTGAFWPFGWALAVIFSRRLQQLNVPLHSLDTSRGMTSEVVPYVDAASGRQLFTAWVRQLPATGNIIYAGAYGVCQIPRCATPCLRVVFPLPNGNAMVIMRPEVHGDGSLTLTSAGDGFGAPGFYFTIQDRDGHVRARYLKTLRETIHVYADGDEVRADHVLTLWRLTFLRVHYRLRARAEQV